MGRCPAKAAPEFQLPAPGWTADGRGGSPTALAERLRSLHDTALAAGRCSSGLIPASSASFDRRFDSGDLLAHIAVGLQELDRPLFLLIPPLGDRVEAVLQRVVLPLVRTQGVEDVKVLRELQLPAQLLRLALDLVRESWLRSITQNSSLRILHTTGEREGASFNARRQDLQSTCSRSPSCHCCSSARDLAA
jgi:hypothetical protein